MKKRYKLLYWFLNPTIKPRKRKRVSAKEKLEYQKYKDQARALVIKKIEKYNRFYNFKYNRLTIRNQVSRWGSCSQLGNLNFNYKIIFLPEKLADYIIVHELCHLKEFNHSPRFWALVAQTFPDYLQLRKDLKKIKTPLPGKSVF